MRNTLKKLGLDDQEVQLYLTALSLNQVPASVLAKRCGLKRTTVYSMLDKLCKKGMLSKFEKANTTFYHAIDPEVLVERFKQNVHDATVALKSIENLVPVLNQLKSDSNEVKVRYYEGEEGVKNLIDHIVNLEGDILEISSGKKHYYSHIGEYYLKKTISKKSKIKLIETNVSDPIIKNQLDNTQKMNQNEEVKCLDDTNYAPNSSVVIKNNEVTFISYHKKELLGVNISSEIISQNMRSFFNYIWSQSKPYNTNSTSI